MARSTGQTSNRRSMRASCAGVSACFGDRDGYARGPSATTSLATVRRLIPNRRARALMLQPCRCSARRSMLVSSDSTVILPGSRSFEHHRASQGGLPLFQSLLQALLRLQDLCTFRDQNCAFFVITHTLLPILAVIHRLSVTAVVACWLLNAVLPLVISLSTLRPRLATVSFGLMRTEFAIGARYHGGQAGLYLLPRVDVLIVAVPAGAHAVGLYSVAVAIVELTNIATDSAATVVLKPQATMPMQDSAALTVKVTTVSAVFACSGVTAPAASGWIVIPLVFGHASRDSVPALLSLTPSIIALASTRPIGAYLLRLNRPWVQTGMTASAMVGNMLLNLLLIPRFGIVGAGLASSIAYAALAAARLQWFVRAADMHVEALRLAPLRALPGRSWQQRLHTLSASLAQSCLMPDRKLTVMGQGYVGLPLAMRAVGAGYAVVGLEIDKERVRRLSSGDSYVEDVPDAELAAALLAGRYAPTDDQGAVRDFDVAVITVPTPLREGVPDLSYIQAAGRVLASHLRKDALVVLESTTYPGTTEELLVPILEKGSGLKAGVDFFVGYSPERIDPGNRVWGLTNTPKIVSGINRPSLERVTAFYSDLVEHTVQVASPKEAELAKLLENTFRHVNIALVNELAVFAHGLGINVWRAIDAASTKPFGFMRFTPGPGVGGHCLPIDPAYLSWQVKRQLGQPFRFVELANDVNDHMPDYIVRRVGMALNRVRKPVNGSRILVLGLAYKKNSADARESPGVRVVRLLEQESARVHVVDPHVDIDALQRRQIVHSKEVELTRSEVSEADLVVLLVDHDLFDLSLLAGVPVLDTRGALPEGPLVDLL